VHPYNVQKTYDLGQTNTHGTNEPCMKALVRGLANKCVGPIVKETQFVPAFAKENVFPLV